MFLIDRLYKVSVVLWNPSTSTALPKHTVTHFCSYSGPWAPTKTIFGPNESSECDLADGKPPEPLGRDLDGVITVQRVKMNTKHQKNFKMVQEPQELQEATGQRRF